MLLKQSLDNIEADFIASSLCNSYVQRLDVEMLDFAV